MKKLLVILILVIARCNLLAQQEAMFTHYMYNTQAINPAYAGSRGAFTITALQRAQWLGFEGAPVTQTLTMHTPVGMNIGLGLSFLNDKIGRENNTAIDINFSYTVRVSRKGKLVFGLKAGLSMLRVNLTELDIDNPDDPAFSQNTISHFLPNFGFGLYYYTDKYYLGLSTPRLLETDYLDNSISGSADLTSDAKHYYFITGTVFHLSSDLMLKPTGFVKVSKAAPIEVDLSALFIWQETFSAGGMYRTGDAFGLLLGLMITNELEMGYSYDWSFTNKTGRYNSGSHEIILRYDLIYKNRPKIKSPRYF